MIPDLPIDFAALGNAALNYVGALLVAIAGIVILIALCRMGFNFTTNALSGEVEDVVIDNMITTKVYDPQDSRYECYIESDDGIKIGGWSGDSGGKTYFFDEFGNKYE